MKKLRIYCWVATEEKGGKIITDDGERCDISAALVLGHGIVDDCGGRKWIGQDDGGGKWKGGDPFGGSPFAFGHGTSKIG